MVEFGTSAFRRLENGKGDASVISTLQIASPNQA